MKNIYGENKNLTAAQRRMYVSLLYGPYTAHRGTWEHKTLMCLKEKGFVYVEAAFLNATRFARWM